MLLIRSFIATFAAGIILAASGLAFAQTRTTTALKTGYAPVNGLNLYYEIHGTGEPLTSRYLVEHLHAARSAQASDSSLTSR